MISKAFRMPVAFVFLTSVAILIIVFTMSQRSSRNRVPFDRNHSVETISNYVDKALAGIRGVKERNITEEDRMQLDTFDKELRLCTSLGANDNKYMLVVNLEKLNKACCNIRAFLVTMKETYATHAMVVDVIDKMWEDLRMAIKEMEDVFENI